MYAFRNLLTPTQEQRLRALDAWHRARDNKPLRMDCPDTWHDELVRQTDEMDRLGIISWSEWRDLRLEADRAYREAITGADYHGASSTFLARIEHAHR